MLNLKRIIWVSVIVVSLSLVGFLGGIISGKTIGSGSDVSLSEDSYESLRPLIQSMSLIKNNYVDVEKIKQKDLVYGAIKGMVGELDPYSQFMDPQSYKDMREDTKGSFGGLGIEIAIRKNQLTIISPIDGTPAFRAGLEAGDEIMKIDGDSTENITIMDAVHKMRGPKGAKCVLSIRRRGLPEWFDVTIIRDIIKIQSIRYELLEGDIGYVRLTEFMERTGDDFNNALRSLEKQGMKGLVLDLRNNPGGLLNMAAEIAEYFVPQGKLIVYTEGRHKSQNIRFFSSSMRPLKNVPLAVLVNRGSASASEIVAGAIQDWGLGVIVGEKSFGKGSVQTIVPLGDGSALRMTTARYLTPKGQMIHGHGITPDLEVDAFRPNEFMLTLRKEGYFGEFALFYLKRHPKGEEAEKKEEDVEVSESSWKKLKPKTNDEKLKDAFVTWLKEQHVEINRVQMNEDLKMILSRIRQEITKKLKGVQAARKVQLESDIQVQRAKDAIKILLMNTR
jgi:carboxyl-terminal processing protease